MIVAGIVAATMSRYKTPLRYPGGKQRLAGFIRELLIQNRLQGGHYAEPYAGGAGVALELLLSGVVSRIHLNDSSTHIYAFWKAVTREPAALCRRISSASLTVADWKQHREIVRNPDGVNFLDLGFSTFYLNRCNRSGVLTAGVIGGLEQKGKWRLDARFPRNELIRRIEAIALKADKIAISNVDAEEFITKYAYEHLPRATLIYCDPPYYGRSKRLYLNGYTREDHQRVAEVIQRQVRHKWLVSYDRHSDVLKLYRGRRSFAYPLQYSATRSYTGEEIFIFSDDLELPATSSLQQLNVGLSTVARSRDPSR